MNAAARGGGHHRLRRSPRWRQWRRLRWRRAVDRLTGGLLALLVLISLGLGALLWSGALWSKTLATREPGLDAASSYQIETSWSAPDASTLAVPERIVLVYPGGQADALGDPSDPDFRAIWQQISALLAGLTPAQVAVNSGTSFKAAGLAVADLLSGGATTSAGPAVEVDLGPLLPWPQWARLFGATATWSPTPSPPMADRVIILPPGPAVAASGVQSTPTATVVLLAGASGVQIALNSTEYQDLAAALANLRPQVGTRPYGYPVELLSTPQGTGDSFGVAPGVLVPPSSALNWSSITYGPETINADALAATIFPDHLAVRPRRSGSGGSQYTTEDQWSLTVEPATGWFLLSVPEPDQATAPEWFAGLSAAVRYVSGRGGWPLSSWLAWSEAKAADGCALCAPTGETYVFSTRYAGLPVLTPPDVRAPLTITMSSQMGTPSQYLRAIPVPGTIEPAAGTALSAAQAVATVAGDLPQDVLSAQVIAVLPVWAPRVAPAVLAFAWAVEVSIDTGGGAGAQEQTILIDGHSGADLGPWPPV